MDQFGWMAWDKDHLAKGFRHSTGEGEAGEARASFSTLPTEEAGICRPYHHAVNLPPLSIGRIPTPMRDEGRQAPRGFRHLGWYNYTGQLG